MTSRLPPVIDSPTQAEAEASFSISAGDITDASE